MSMADKRASATRARLVVGLGLVACAPGLIAAALCQEPAPARKKPVPADAAAASKTARSDAPAAAKKASPTYSKDVAPILQSKCQSCHRRHQVGPFALDTYEQARRRAHDIASVTEERSMPPWKPTRGVGPKLKHDQSLTRQEIKILASWAEAGAPPGDPKDLPPPPKFAEGWKLGTPDLILEAAEDFPVPASGPDVYRCFVLPTNLVRDTYVDAVDFAPSARVPPFTISSHISIRPAGAASSTWMLRGRATSHPPAQASRPTS